MQSTDKNVLVVFPAWCRHFLNENKPLAANFQTLLWKFAHLLIFCNIEMGLIIIKYRWRAFYFNNRKRFWSLSIICTQLMLRILLYICVYFVYCCVVNTGKWMGDNWSRCLSSWLQCWTREGDQWSHLPEISFTAI